MFRPSYLVLASALMMMPSGEAQRVPGKPGAEVRTFETAHLKLRTSVRADAASATKVSLLLDVAPKPKMHVYAPGQDGFIAIAVTLDANARFASTPPRFPKPEKIFFKALNETQLVYSKPFRIAQDIVFASEAEKGTVPDTPVTIKGSLRYQACDDTICYLPKTAPIEWVVKR